MDHYFDMDPAAWAALRRLLDAALALPAAQRVAWVDALGAEHDALKPRLLALLTHAAGNGSEQPLDTLPKLPTMPGAAAARGGATALRPGATIGPYRLIRLLGEGGMGEVWLAERDEPASAAQVALKIPHGAWRRAGLAERLQRERTILAGLEHPHIAGLRDAGVVADGQPYLALEYVEGERIDEYCTRLALDVPARLRLFLQAAEAVAFAHSRQVVHRDLKPANVLVDRHGRVRLLDFGIAKLLDRGVAVETDLTRQVGRAFTPAYASPEQISGGPTGAASDVYSLGVVLCELLTGARPPPGEVPRRPSDMVTEPLLRDALRGDLDAIVLKALRCSPLDRYRSVDVLAEDLVH